MNTVNKSKWYIAGASLYIIAMSLLAIFSKGTEYILTLVGIFNVVFSIIAAISLLVVMFSKNFLNRVVVKFKIGDLCLSMMLIESMLSSAYGNYDNWATVALVALLIGASVIMYLRGDYFTKKRK